MPIENKNVEHITVAQKQIIQFLLLLETNFLLEF